MTGSNVYFDNSQNIIIDIFYYINLHLRLKRRARVGYFFANNVVGLIIWIGWLCIWAMMFYGFETKDLLMMGWLWIPSWLMWVYHCPKILYWFPIYFYLICCYIDSQLALIEQKLIILDKSPLSLRNKDIILRNLMKRHQKTCALLEHYNHYWQPFIAQTLVIFLAIILFLSYINFFTAIPLYLRIEFTIILIVKTLFLLLILVSASVVSHRTNAMTYTFNSVCAQSLLLRTLRKVINVSQKFYS